LGYQWYNPATDESYNLGQEKSLDLVGLSVAGNFGDDRSRKMKCHPLHKLLEDLLLSSQSCVTVLIASRAVGKL
jgi:hypothetical protein